MHNKVITDDQQELVEELREKLMPLTNAFNPPAICWITDGDSAAEDYCPDCIDAAVAKLKPEYPDAIADGGYDWFRGNDGCSSCDSCGKTLSYSLTQHGFSAEVDHFMGVDFSQPTDGETAFAVDAILSECEWCKDAEQIANAIEIGKQAVASIPN